MLPGSPCRRRDYASCQTRSKGKRLVQMTTKEKIVQPDRVASLAPTGSDEWVGRLKRGDETAVEELFGCYQAKAYRLCFGILKSETDAREAAQDALAEAAQKISQFAGRSSFGTWIYRIVANHALMRLRSLSRRREATLPADRSSGAETAVWDELACGTLLVPDQEVISEDSMKAVEKLCAQLPEKYCPIVWLCDFEEIPLPLAAARLGLTARGGKSRLHRGRVQLRKLICGLGELCGPWCAKGFQRAGPGPL